MVAGASIKGDDISPAAMKGKSIGAQSSTVFANWLEKTYPGVEVKLYPGGDEPFLDLASGRIDYVSGDILVAEKFMEKNPGCCRIVDQDPALAGHLRPRRRRRLPPGRQGPGRHVQQGHRRGRTPMEAYKKIADKYFKIDIRGK